MSEKYVTSEGYRPLIIPARGEELQMGRQYALTPLFRLILREEYGLANVPTIVTCIRVRVGPTRMITRMLNLERKTEVETVTDLPTQNACFEAYLGGGKHVKFDVDLARVESLVPLYDKSHKLPALEQDWLNNRHLPPTHHKFRGCSLRWWEKGAIMPKVPGSARRAGSGSTRSKPDTSLLD